jgi:hypothetical protein
MDFTNRIHRVGRITVLVCLTCFIGLPIVLSFIFHAPINYALTAQNGLSIFVMFVVASICEITAYTPIVGPGAIYAACVSGELANMKVPAAINAMQVVNVQPGSEKGNIVSIIAVSTCTFFTTALALLGMIFLAPIVAVVFNNPIINPAFANIIPALFGALIVPSLVKAPKESLPVFVLPIIILLIIGPKTYGAIQGYLILGVGIIAICYSYLLNKKKIDAAKIAQSAAAEDEK